MRHYHIHISILFPLLKSRDHLSSFLPIPSISRIVLLGLRSKVCFWMGYTKRSNQGFDDTISCRNLIPSIVQICLQIIYLTIHDEYVQHTIGHDTILRKVFCLHIHQQNVDIVTENRGRDLNKLRSGNKRRSLTAHLVASGVGICHFWMGHPG